MGEPVISKPKGTVCATEVTDPFPVPAQSPETVRKQPDVREMPLLNVDVAEDERLMEPPVMVRPLAVDEELMPPPNWVRPSTTKPPEINPLPPTDNLCEGEVVPNPKLFPTEIT